jgi:hypothetical protein
MMVLSSSRRIDRLDATRAAQGRAVQNLGIGGCLPESRLET